MLASNVSQVLVAPSILASDFSRLGEEVLAVTDNRLVEGDAGVFAATIQSPDLVAAFDNFIVRKP